MTMVSPRRFFILFFSSFLQAYIFPVERVWQAQTSPNPPLPENDSIIDCFNRIVPENSVGSGEWNFEQKFEDIV